YAFAHQFYWDFRRLSEGHLRSHFDKKQYEQLAEQIQAADIQLDDQQKARILEVVEEEIKDGRLQGSDREKRVRDLEDGHRAATRVGLLFDVEEKVRRAIKVPGEPEVIELLLNSG